MNLVAEAGRAVAEAGRAGAEAGRAAVEARPTLDHLTGKCGLAYRVSVGDVFKALADPTRRAILDELQSRNGQTLFELCVRLGSRHGLGLTRQAVSQHLDVLESAGLVRSRREGRYKFHELDTAPLRAITERWKIDRERRKS
jgi:DNA-binding transcriptional ArsR family regulator